MERRISAAGDMRLYCLLMLPRHRMSLGELTLRTGAQSIAVDSTVWSTCEQRVRGSNPGTASASLRDFAIHHAGRILRTSTALGSARVPGDHGSIRQVQALGQV